jgi:hypothetical protein
MGVSVEVVVVVGVVDKGTDVLVTVFVLVGITVFSVDGPGMGVSLPPGFHLEGGFLVGLGVAVNTLVGIGVTVTAGVDVWVLVGAAVCVVVGVSVVSSTGSMVSDDRTLAVGESVFVGVGL